MQKILVKLGQKVKKGEQIGENGTGNGQWPAHLHYDCPRYLLASWNQYVYGWTMDEVAREYADPKPWRMIVAPWFHHFGWEYLEFATYGMKKCFHPGEDLNGKGSGNSDLGMPVYAPCDGTVVHVHDGMDSNGGWGKLLVIREDLVIPENPIVEPKNEVVPQKESDMQAPPKPIQSVESGVSYQSSENNMNLQGYRTILSAVLAFLVTMGTLSQVEADKLTEGVLALLSLVTLVSTIYYRLQAKK